MIVDIIQKTKIRREYRVGSKQLKVKNVIYYLQSGSKYTKSFFCDIYNIGNDIDVINNVRGIENEKLIYNNHLKEFMKVIKYLVGKRIDNLIKINTSKKNFKAYYLSMKTKGLDGYPSKILIEF